MKPEIKKLWVDALRSGDYKQGAGRLRNDDNEFCCLGVLCNLHAQAFPEEAKEERDVRFYKQHSAYLPLEVQEWAGLTHNSGADVRIGADRDRDDLASHNDKGVSFKMLADAIEEQL